MLTNCSRYISVVQILINFFVYLFFIMRIFEGKMKFGYWRNRLVVVSYAVFSTVFIVSGILKNSFFPQHRYLLLVIWLVGTVLTGIYLMRSNLLQLLFVIFVFLDIQFNIMQFSAIIYNINVVPRVVKSEGIHILIINNLVLIAFIPFMWYLFIGLFKKVINLNIGNLYWKYMFIIPTIAYIYCVFTSINYTYNNERGWGVALFILILLNLLSLLSYIVVLQMMIRINESVLASEIAAFTQQQLAIQEEQYRKLAENIEHAERMRHDMRHHFIVLKGHLKNNEFEKADSYLDECIGKELLKDEQPICENHSVDMILRHYIGTARKNGVQVKTVVHLPNNLRITNKDLCTILGNLVENAVEGCGRQKSGRKFIEIKTKIFNEYILVITVINSYDGSIRRGQEGFVSQKHDGTGVGTCSVMSVVEKNGGNCKFHFENNIFKASVLLVQ